MQNVRFHMINLAKAKGKGDIKCPKCETGISPDDKSDETYTILEPVMKGNYLEKIVIQCNKCGSQIHLTGFNILNQTKQAI